MPYHKHKYHSKHRKISWTTISKGAVKVLLTLLVLTGLGLLAWYGYLVFSHKVQPIVGAIVFLIGVVAWILLVRFLRRRYGKVKPSFKLTTFSVVAVILVFTFAGVQPLAQYKDNLIDKCATTISKWSAESEETQVEIPEKPQDEKQEMTKTEDNIVQNEQQKIECLEHAVVELVNSIRTERGSNPLSWDDQLHRYSKEHSEAMARRCELFHSQISEPYAENCWGGEGSTNWGAADIVES